jgi:hypothetical protein
MQTIFRTRLTANFTTLPNAMLRDNSLSFRARGMLAMILSNVSDWQAGPTWLKGRGTEGVSAIRATLHELERAGYAVYTQERDANARWSNSVWTFFDSPVAPEQRSDPADRCWSTKTPANKGDRPRCKNTQSGGAEAKKDHRKEKLLSKEAKEDAPPAPRSVSPEWKPDPRSKEQLLDALPVPKSYLSQPEFEALASDCAPTLLDYRPDLYAHLCRHKWRVWSKPNNRWQPIRNLKAFLVGLEARIGRASA